MMESVISRINSVKSAISILPHVICFCMVFPLVLWKFLQRALPDDLTLSVVCFPPSREATSKFCWQNFMASSYATLHHLAIYKEHIYIYSATSQYHTIQHHDDDMHIVHRSVLYILYYNNAIYNNVCNTVYIILYIYMCVGLQLKAMMARAIQSNNAKIWIVIN